MVFIVAGDFTFENILVDPAKTTMLGRLFHTATILSGFENYQ